MAKTLRSTSSFSWTDCREASTPTRKVPIGSRVGQAGSPPHIHDHTFAQGKIA